MIKKYLHRWLSTERIQQELGDTWLGNRLSDRHLWMISCRSVAKGVAIGLLLAFLPLPIQMLLAAFVALLFRANIPAAVIMTWVTNPFTFVPINYFIFRVGQYVTGDSKPLPDFSKFDSEHIDWGNLAATASHWLSYLGKSFFVGLPIVAVTAALLGFLFVHIMWRLVLSYLLWKKRSHAIKKSDPLVK